jgi:hypothetical protein
MSKRRHLAATTTIVASLRALERTTFNRNSPVISLTTVSASMIDCSRTGNQRISRPDPALPY